MALITQYDKNASVPVWYFIRKKISLDTKKMAR